MAAQNERGAQGNDTAAAHVKSAGVIIGEIKRHKTGAAVIVAIAVAAIAGLAYGLYRLTGRNQPRPGAPLQTMEMTRLTTSGKVLDAAISPDGKYVAYINDDAGQQSLWVRQLAKQSSVRIIEGQYLDQGMTFSPDGSYIYYRARVARYSSETTLYRIPVLGGAARKVIANVSTAPTFSPDGKQMAFVRNDDTLLQAESHLIVANTDGTDERPIRAHEITDSFAEPSWPVAPAWSPDGKALVCATGLPPKTLIEVRLDSGAERPISSDRWQVIDRISWLSDGSRLVLAAQDQVSEQNQIWQVAYPSGETRRVTSDLNSYRGLSLTADSSAMIAAQSIWHWGLWIVPGDKAGEGRLIASGEGTSAGNIGLAWTPDGKLVYTSSANGISDLWSIDPGRGNAKKQLTSEGGLNLRPVVTPDGRYIVFYSNRAGGGLDLWRMDIDGGSPEQLTRRAVPLEATGQASCSRDSRWIVYQYDNGLWKVSIDGGMPVKLTDKWAELPSVSPDGKQIACQFPGRQQQMIGLVPWEGGQVTNVGEPPARIQGMLRWTRDGSAIAYICDRYICDRGGVSNIWAMPVSGGPPKQLTDVKSAGILYFDWSFDGKQLALSRGSLTQDVVLISNFR